MVDLVTATMVIRLLPYRDGELDVEEESVLRMLTGSCLSARLLMFTERSSPSMSVLSFTHDNGLIQVARMDANFNPGKDRVLLT